MFTLKALALPRKSAMRISTAFASGSAGEDATTGGFSSEIAANGKANPAIRKRASDARSRVIGSYLFAVDRAAARVIAAPPHPRLAVTALPEWKACIVDPLLLTEWADSAADNYALGEHDLDAPVLRLAYTERRRHPWIIHTAAGDDHFVTRHTHTLESSCHGVGTALREPLIVAGRPGKIGVAGDLDLHRTARLVVGRRGFEDLGALRGDVVFIPVEEHQIDLMRRWRRWCRRGRRGRCRRRVKHHRQAGDDVLRTVFDVSDVGDEAACGLRPYPINVRRAIAARSSPSRGPDIAVVNI